MKRRPQFYRIHALWRVLLAGGEVPTDIPPLSRVQRGSVCRGLIRDEGVDHNRNRLFQFISRLFSIEEDGLVAGPFRQFLDIISDSHGSYHQADPVPQSNEAGLNVRSDPTSDEEHPRSKRISAGEMVRRISIAPLDHAELL